MKPSACKIGLMRVVAAFAALGATISSSRAIELDDARLELERTIEAYRSLRFYRDEGQLVIDVAQGDRTESIVQPMRWLLARPNLVVLNAGLATLASDGKTLTTILGPTSRHLTEPAPAEIKAWHITEGSAGAMLFGGPSSAISDWVVRLVLEPETAKRLLAEAKHVAAESDAPLNDRVHRRVRLERASGPPLLFWIDPETHLLSRAELITEKPDDEDAKKTAHVSIYWLSGKVETTEIAPTAFAIKPPPNSMALAPPKPREVAAAGARPKHALVGQPLPRFTLKVFGAPADSPSIKSETLAGKVIVLDFWATWCPPCREELPELAKLAQEFASKSANVSFIAISQDEAPRDGDSQKLVASTLKELGVESPALRIALDPDAITGNLFEVTALPTLFVVDVHGAVREVILGYQDGSIDALRKSIQSLLDESQAKSEPKP